MAKVYIVGSVGSGKTTLAKKLSSELDIKHYELDDVTWEYNPSGDDRKRSDEEILEIFSSILNKKDWIIENVGKDIYNAGFDKADTIIYLKIRKINLYKQIVFRWIKQKLKIEKSPMKPSLKVLRQMLKWADKELKSSKLNILGNYNDKLIILTEKTVNKYNYKNRL